MEVKSDPKDPKPGTPEFNAKFKDVRSTLSNLGILDDFEASLKTEAAQDLMTNLAKAADLTEKYDKKKYTSKQGSKAVEEKAKEEARGLNSTLNKTLGQLKALEGDGA